MKIEEQDKVLENDKKNMLVSASAGSGKTYVMIKYITKLICENKVPVNNLLILTFTKAAASEMKERLQKKLKEFGHDEYIVDQLDAMSTANISTIHSFCEKSIKKYANLLGINNNFSVADESVSQSLKQAAFEKAFKKFNVEHLEEHNHLMSAYKNDKQKIKHILFEIETLANAVAEKDEFLQKITNQSEECFFKAEKYILENTKKILNHILEQIETLHIKDFEKTVKLQMYEILNSNNLQEMSFYIEKFSFPMLPKRKIVGDDVIFYLTKIKNQTKKLFEKILLLNLQSAENIDLQKSAILEKLLLTLYQIYQQEENRLKLQQNYLDFNDLEKYMKVLSEKENLFSDIQYVFVDEYQDTNKIQERIVKNITKNSNFVAVGDVKQGIYGFRLASCEIFLKDLQDFTNESNSSVRFLKSNFRSSQKVLDFVNDIFSVCMTKDISGVDYCNDSMLEGKSEFVDEGCKAVQIDLICKDKKHEKDLPIVYSVIQDSVTKDDSNEKILHAIKSRINEVMNSQISVDGKLRKCKYSDIAVLSRKRNQLFNDVEDFLQSSGIPVLSNSRNVLLDELEIKVLLNYLKIALNLDDDIALLSVLLSSIGKFDLEEIAIEKLNAQLSLSEVVKINKNGKFNTFLAHLQCFRKDIAVVGIRKAFLNLFNKVDYKAYINSQKNQHKLNNFVDRFLSEIENGEFEYDLPGLINFFQTVDISVSSQSDAFEDAVLLTTIHNSKGLEYPIVFLIGCDQSLKKTKPKPDVALNEEFGLAIKYFDEENNKEIDTVKMRAVKDKEDAKDFVEELMIFYVALTRAKNRLYLFGFFDDNSLKTTSLYDCDSYFDLFFFSHNHIAKALENEDFYQDDSLSICKIDEIVLEEENHCENFSIEEISENMMKKVEDYLNFVYKFDDRINFKLKESVTSLSQKDNENALQRYSNENFQFNNNLIEIGNAYHLALKTLDFEKIFNIDDLKYEIKQNNAVFCDILEYLNLEVLLKNLLLIKNITKNCQIFKEKTFIMKEKLCNLLENCQFDDEIMIQGIVDLFAIREDKIILIDYKYSSSQSEQYLKEKYKNQLKLYKMALENAFEKKVDEIYLLSLKNNKLIYVDF